MTEYFTWFYYIIIGLGVFKVLEFIYELVDVFVLKRYYGSRLSHYLKPGAWAIITGATDGIGKEFAHQLAAKGFNIFLLSRTESRLNAEASEIAQKYKVSVKTHSIDFSKPDADYDGVATQVKAINGPITILINNVGKTHEFPERYLDTDPQAIKDIVTLNITTTNEMTRIVLPEMIKNKNGLVVNVSTSAALVPTPMLAVYSASKTYVNVFTKILQKEYSKDGIHFEALTPFYVVTKLSKMRKSRTTPTPAAYVTSALASLGSRVGPHAGFLVHDILQVASKYLPESLVMDRVLAMHESIRTRALAKKAQSPQTSEQPKPHAD